MVRHTSFVGAFEGEEDGEAVGLFEGCELKRQENSKNVYNAHKYKTFTSFSFSFDIRTR